MLPCLPLVEACQLVKRFEGELTRVHNKNLQDATNELAAIRHRAIESSFYHHSRYQARLLLRHAFDELVLHTRLEGLRMLRRHTAVRRMARALARPQARQVRETFSHLADLIAADIKAALSICVAEQRKAREKVILNGVLILQGLIDDWEQASCHEALLLLSRNAEGARRLEASGVCSIGDIDQSCIGRRRGPLAALTQRLHVAGRLLEVSIRHMQAARREAALRKWSMVAARCQQAEAQELIRQTAELNQKIMDRCKQMPIESSLHGMVVSIQSAMHRRTLFAFVAWERRSFAFGGDADNLKACAWQSGGWQHRSSELTASPGKSSAVSSVSPCTVLTADT